eukprot:jgi/Hompol1/1030/HPOL_005492-RA
MGVEDFSIEPLPGHRSILNGFLGVTDKLALRGLVSFKTTKDIKVSSLSLVLHGRLKTALSSDEGHYTAEVPLLASVLRIVDPADDPNGEKATKKWPAHVPVKAGSPAYEFEIEIPQQIAEMLPGSFSHQLPAPVGNAAAHAKAAATASTLSRKKTGTTRSPSPATVDETDKANWNGAKVYYTLTATLETLQSSLLSVSVKTFNVVEEVDFHRIDSFAVARSVHTNSGRLVQGSDDHISYKFELDRTTFTIGQAIQVNIIELLPHEHQFSISGVTLNLVQVEKLRAFRDRKFNNEPHHLPEDPNSPDVTSRYKQRVVKSVLDSVEVPRPTRGFAKFVASLRKKIEPWSGQAALVIDSTHHKLKNDPKHKSVDAYQSFDSEFITVTHHVEVRVKLVNSADVLIYPVPVRFLDIDHPTVDWVLHNSDSLTGGPELGEDDADAKSGYIFDEDDLPRLAPVRIPDAQAALQIPLYGDGYEFGHPHVKTIGRIQYADDSKHHAAASLSQPAPHIDLTVPHILSAGNHTWAMFEIECTTGRTHRFAVGNTDAATATNNKRVGSYVANRAHEFCVPATSVSNSTTSHLTKRGDYRFIQAWVKPVGWNPLQYDLRFANHEATFYEIYFLNLFSAYPSCNRLDAGDDDGEINIGLERAVTSWSQGFFNSVTGQTFMYLNDAGWPRWGESYVFETRDVFDDNLSYSTCYVDPVYQASLDGHGCSVGNVCHT